MFIIIGESLFFVFGAIIAMFVGRTVDMLSAHPDPASGSIGTVVVFALYLIFRKKGDWTRFATVVSVCVGLNLGLWADSLPVLRSLPRITF